MKRTYHRRKIHLWAPNIFGYTGGLQKHLYFILSAIQELLPNSDIRVFLKLDRKSDLLNGHISPNTRFYCSGDTLPILRNICFSIRIFMHCLFDRPELLVIGHVNFTPVAWIIRRITGVPYCVVSFGIESWVKNKYFLSKALRDADRIFSMSDYTRNRISAKHDIRLNKISLLHGTFDSGCFRIAPKPEYLLKKYRLREDQPVILTVCRLERSEQYKGYDKMIEALPEIAKSFPDTRYILVGSGDDLERIKSIVSEHKLGDNVIIAGAFIGKELCDHYNLCDCFAMPSKQEGFGIVFIEALACGKPVLAGNQDGSVDALNKGELGVLVDPNNVNDISKELIRILKHEYPNPIIYEPEALRKKAIEYFGFGRFKETIGNYLEGFFPDGES